MQNWYAVQTKPRQESKAELNLKNQGYQTYLPKIRHRKRRHDHWTYVTEPLFPRYLFIHADPAQQGLAPVRSTFGVSKLVRFGQLLQPVPDSVIHYLQQLESMETGAREDTSCPHTPGDTVEVLEGPFAGLKGIYQMQNGDNRALLLIELLGRSNKISVEMDDIA